MKKYFSFLIIVLFLGCSREYYSPDKKVGFVKVSGSLDSDVEFFTKEIATLKNNKTIPFHKQLPDGFVAIDAELSKKGEILQVNNKQIKFNSLIVTASKKDNLLAILFGDNHFELYDLNKSKVVFSSNFGDCLATREFVASPYFYKDLLLIPSLNGKVIVFELSTNKIIRTIIISEKDYFNNIIYLDVKNEHLVMASRDKIVVLTSGFQSSRSYSIKNVLVTDNFIYLFTTEGDVKQLNFALKEIKSINFKYANIIFPIFFKDKIYFLIRGEDDYLVVLDKNLTNYQVKEIDGLFDSVDLSKDNVFGNKGVYYIGDSILKVDE